MNKKMAKNKLSTYILILIFIISFLIRLIPLYKGYNVPFGFVDTSSHIASALDLSEGDFKSVLHPWWHLKNHFLINGYDVVDRASVSFFYAPFIHIVLALGFLLLNPGIASIIIISALYSLSVVAIFLLCKSFKFKDTAALVSALVIAVSVPLTYSQNFGFWTFLIAFNFLILSYSFLRLKSRKSNLIAIFFCFLSFLTHWAFFPLFVLIGLVEMLINKNNHAKLYILCAVLMALPVFAYNYSANKFSYVATHFNGLIFPSGILIVLAAIGLLTSFKKYKEVAIFTAFTLTASIAYYLIGIKFIFGDMVQFSYPFFTAFYAGSLFQDIDKQSINKNINRYTNKKIQKGVKIAFAILVLFAVLSDFFAFQNVFGSAKPSITNKDFNGLLKLRKEFVPDEKSVIAIDKEVGWWLTIASKDSKIVYPGAYDAEDMQQYYKNYISKRVDAQEGYVFYKITRRNSTLVLEKNVTMGKEYMIGKI